MPNPSHSGILIAPWHDCDRCGVSFRVTELTWQNGLLLCKDDVDNPIMWQRDQMIQEVLGNGQPEADVAEILKNPNQESEPFST